MEEIELESIMPTEDEARAALDSLHAHFKGHKTLRRSEAEALLDIVWSRLNKLEMERGE